MKIWIDADACPKMIKEVVYKATGRLKIEACLVANSFLNVPPSPYISFVQVDQGADVADQYIAQNVEKSDLVITADIPLAAIIVEKEVTAINPRGEVYTEDNITERLSVRNFMQELRDSGVKTGGPAPLGPKDKEKFTNSFNKTMTKLIKQFS